ncbi:MAG TPA: hypothetical protein VGG39_36720 [Polyangiaceae bacterium]|jgi:hypothetical protein
MRRLNDPVWQAFEREPSPNDPPLTEDESIKTQRGLEHMRRGLFVAVDTGAEAKQRK